MAELVTQDLIEESVNALGDERLVGTELETTVAENPEQHAADHLSRADDRELPALRRSHHQMGDPARDRVWWPVRHRQPEDRHDVGEDARVVDLLQARVKPDRLALGGDAAVDLAEADPEALRLVGARRREEPEGSRIEPRLEPASIEVAEVGGSVDPCRRAHGRRVERVEECLPAREGSPAEVRCPVTLEEEPQIAVVMRVHPVTPPDGRRDGPRPARAPQRPRPRTRPRTTAPRTPAQPAARRCRPATSLRGSSSLLTSWTRTLETGGSRSQSPGRFILAGSCGPVPRDQGSGTDGLFPSGTPAGDTSRACRPRASRS